MIDPRFTQKRKNCVLFASVFRAAMCRGKPLFSANSVSLCDLRSVQQEIRSSTRSIALWTGALLLLIGASLANTAAAHPVSITSTYAYVTREKLSVNIEVFIEDLYLFHNLKPNDRDFLAPDDIDKGIEKHKKFLDERFTIRDVNGQPLQGRLVKADKSKVPDEGVPLAELMAHKVVFQYDYELPAVPEFLTFSQHFMDDKILVPSEMRLIVKQEGAGTLLTATLKPDEPRTFRLSWTNPPLAPDASEEEWENWIAKQKEETLGISSYSSVYSFLYINDREVRHEILIPLLTLEDSVLLARDADDFLDIAEQDAARQQIEAFFSTGNPIEIDGTAVKPVVERCDFYGLDFKDFAMQAKRKPVSLASARVGIILSYPAKSTPSTVKLTWNRFNNYVWAVDMVVYAFDSDASKVTLTSLGQNNEFQWKNPGRDESHGFQAVNVTLPAQQQWSIPIASVASLVALLVVLGSMSWLRVSLAGHAIAVVLLGAVAALTWPLARWQTPDPLAEPARVSNTEADRIFQTLHANTYRAFQYRDESEIYDALSTSVDGDLLRELYLQIRHGLEMQEQGGAVSHVREVKIVEGGKEEPPSDSKIDSRGFRYRCRWTVNGTVEHWGHIHSRTNQYEGLFTVEPDEDQWKITSLELLDEKRVGFETNLRGL